MTDVATTPTDPVEADAGVVTEVGEQAAEDAEDDDEDDDEDVE